MNKKNTKYCTQCGEKLRDGDALCRNCGAPVPAQAPPRPGSRRRKTLIVTAAAAAAAVLALAGWLLVSRLTGSPVTKFLSLQAALFSDRVLEPLEALDEHLGPGKLDTDITVTGSVDNDALASCLDRSSLSLQADVQEDSALFGCEINLMGSTVLNGTVAYENSRLGIYLPELDQNYYIMDLAPAGPDAAGHSADQSGSALPLLSLAQLRTALSPYWDAVTALVNERNITRKDAVTGSMGYLPFDRACSVYAFQPQEDALEQLALALAELLEQDGGLRDLLRETLSAAIVRLSLRGTDSADAAGQAEEALTWLAGVLRDNAASIARELAAAGFTWSVAVEDDTVRQVRLSASDPDTQTVTGLAYEFTDGDGELHEALYAFRGDDTYPLLTHSRVSAGETASGEICLSAGDTPLLRLDYASQDGRLSPLGLPYGSFTLTVAGLDAELSLAVRDSSSGGTDHVLAISGMADYTDGFFNDLTLTANAVAGSTVLPPEPAPVDVTDFSDEQKQEIVDGMIKAFRNDLLANLWPLLGYVLR